MYQFAPAALGSVDCVVLVTGAGLLYTVTVVLPEVANGMIIYSRTATTTNDNMNISLQRLFFASCSISLAFVWMLNAVSLIYSL